MNATTHMAIGGMTGGLAVAVGLANHTLSFGFLGYEIYPLLVAAAGVAGGIAPDIDMRQSKAGRILRKVMRVGLVASALFLVAMYFVPPTGIAILDGAIGMGARVDRGVPLMLAAFCIFVLVAVEKSKHRGFTHTLVGLLFVAMPLIFMLETGVMFVGADIAVSVQIGFVLGWFSHMVIDTFNSAGIPWLWPLLNKRFKIMKIKTGTEREVTFLAVSTVVFLAAYVMIVL